MKEAEARAAAVVRDAETRAAELVDGAAQQVVALDRQAATIRAQFTQMRDSFRAANDAATAALRQLASVDEDREPALQAKRA